MTLTIHMGVYKDEIRTLNSQIKRLLPGAEHGGADLQCDGDLWNAWNQQPILNENEPLHVRIDTIAPMATLNLLVSRFETFLIPRYDGPKLVVTDTDAEEVEYIEFRYPE